VYAVSGDGKRNVEMVVYEEGNVVRSSNGKEAQSLFIILTLGKPFCTKLNRVGASRARPLHHLTDAVGTEKAFVNDHV
jgi:hypothetical protein